jgi:hypothetical protein
VTGALHTRLSRENGEKDFGKPSRFPADASATVEDCELGRVACALELSAEERLVRYEEKSIVA